MKEFKPGWYVVQRNLIGERDCMYFIDPMTFTARCLLGNNGSQSQWWDAERYPPAREYPWDESFEPMPYLVSGVHWDHYTCTLGNAETQAPIEVERLGRERGGYEAFLRSTKADTTGKNGACTQEIHVGVFFDGTNNNMVRDKPLNSHSNIVSLYEAHKDDHANHFAYYLPGVGTAFPEIGEAEELSSGKSFATGGEARIHWAMLQVYNAVCTSFYDHSLIDQDEMRTIVTEELSSFYRRRINDNQMRRTFQQINKRLLQAILGKRPRIVKLNLSVFGFSRGAAEARVFCNWIREASGGMIGEAELNLRFLGIFDTVASVGLADSSPVGRGFFDWAHNNLTIGDIENTVHYLAGHEIRRSFPASTVRTGSHWPKNTKEYVYPGAHSDIGGGYAPGDQGKSRGGRSTLLSQIPLNDMYEQAYNGGVKLKRRDQMGDVLTADFAIDPDMHAAFMAFLNWTREVHEKEENLVDTRVGRVNSRMHTQMQYYWRWRASKKTETQFKAMDSYQHASEQDQVDLWEAELDWQADIKQARIAHLPRKRAFHFKEANLTSVEIPPNASQTQKDLISVIDKLEPIPELADRFFDRYVHDSHAGFWLLGPLTLWDKKQFVAEIRKKKLVYDTLAAQDDEYHFVADAVMISPHFFALNRFEQKVFDANGPGEDTKAPWFPYIPVIRDEDAADLRSSMGIGGLVVKYGMGSGTRREANGCGQYRRLFDDDNEAFAVLDEAGRYIDKAVDAIGNTVEDLTKGPVKKAIY